MKSTVTTSETFKYILIFTFLFAAFLALAITYNRVYKLKNESISIFEKYEGVTSKSLNVVNNYLKNNGYNTKGKCNKEEYGVSDLNTNNYKKVTNENENFYYCLSYKCKTGNCKIIDKDKAPNGNQIYYNIKLFYKFNLPFVGEIFTFTINGETKGIKYYDTKQRL